jgi:chromate transporter
VPLAAARDAKLDAATVTAGSMRELVAYFLRLGTTDFGGPVALVGFMECDLVTEHGWLTR